MLRRLLPDACTVQFPGQVEIAVHMLLSHMAHMCLLSQHAPVGGIFAPVALPGARVRQINLESLPLHDVFMSSRHVLAVVLLDAHA
jgi:hypothetical protein